MCKSIQLSFVWTCNFVLAFFIVLGGKGRSHGMERGTARGRLFQWREPGVQNKIPTAYVRFGRMQEQRGSYAGRARTAMNILLLVLVEERLQKDSLIIK
jgi:hypothetical protein